MPHPLLEVEIVHVKKGSSKFLTDEEVSKEHPSGYLAEDQRHWSGTIQVRETSTSQDVMGDHPQLHLPLQ